jgi:hypothetical protein
MVPKAWATPLHRRKPAGRRDLTVLAQEPAGVAKPRDFKTGLLKTARPPVRICGLVAQQPCANEAIATRLPPRTACRYGAASPVRPVALFRTPMSSTLSGHHAHLSPNLLEDCRAIADSLLPYCISLFWHDSAAGWPRRIRGGSCFVLHIGDRFIGVTAAHVIEALQRDRSSTGGLFCQLGKTGYDPRPFVIGWDTRLDVATFSVPPHAIAACGGRPVDVAISDWPSPHPRDGEALVLTGFPESSIRTEADFSAAFYAYGALTVAETVTDTEILVTYDPARDRDLIGHCPPPLGFNMSGCSGGPVFAVRRDGESVRSYPVGLIFRGPGERPSGSTMGFDIIRARRIHMIREDGTLDQAGSGWLPR